MGWGKGWGWGGGLGCGGGLGMKETKEAGHLCEMELRDAGPTHILP